MALYVGLMSGTSLDGVDGVLADLDDTTLRPRQVLSAAHRSMPADLAAELLALNRSGADELHRSAIAANRMMQLYADVTADLLRQSGRAAPEVKAIGAHGQTVRHKPPVPGSPAPDAYTLQLANGAVLAERSGITTVCDFRSADIAVGGQGAPLVPAFHAACWAEAGKDVAVLNVGGIANLTLLYADGRVGGFDTGPGNLLLDHWSQRAFGQPFDRDGAHAAAGQVLPDLLARLLAEPYLHAAPPKSTGRDLFGPDWLDERAGDVTAHSAEDVMATLAELTLRSVFDALMRHLPGVERLWVCGGGAFNAHLMNQWRTRLPGVMVNSTQALGVPPEQVEALAFAWLAACRLQGRTANEPAVTGARRRCVLGAVHAAP